MYGEVALRSVKLANFTDSWYTKPVCRQGRSCTSRQQHETAQMFQSSDFMLKNPSCVYYLVHAVTFSLTCLVGQIVKHCSVRPVQVDNQEGKGVMLTDPPCTTLAGADASADGERKHGGITLLKLESVLELAHDRAGQARLQSRRLVAKLEVFVIHFRMIGILKLLS